MRRAKRDIGKPAGGEGSRPGHVIDIDEVAGGSAMLIAAVASMLLVTCLIALVGHLESWWMLGVALAGYAVVGTAVFVGCMRLFRDEG